MITKKFFFTCLCLSMLNLVNAQDDEEKSVIQEYTPSILLNKGQWDIKWFNNLYTQTRENSNNKNQDVARSTFFTSTIDVFTGLTENRSINVGLLIEMRSNVINDRSAFEVFSFNGERGVSRSGITSISPAIKFNPIKSIGNFTIQSSIQIPLVDNETEDGVFLDQSGLILQNRFFYDYNFSSGNWQLFTELNTEYNFKKEENGVPVSFASNSLRLTPGAFISYFPSSKSTILGFAQHIQLIPFETNGFAQNATILGFGGKYQLTDELNIEALYSNFVRGKDSGLGQTFNIGLRALF